MKTGQWILAMLAVTGLAAAQDNKPTSKVVDVKYRDPDRIARLVYVPGVQGRADNEFHVIVVTGPAQAVSDYEAMVKRFDVPAPNIELRAYLVSGSAKEGVHHWWMQRLTSVALIPLTIWFVVSILSLPTFDHVAVIAWMSQTYTALFLILLVLVVTWHSQLGVRVVVEDYVHGGSKTLVLVLLTFIHAMVAVAGVFAVLKVAFGGAA